MNIYSQHAIPDLTQARNILCVQPHYDDNDIGAGGSLVGLAGLGVGINYLTVTNDLVGVIDPFLPDDEASRQLHNEQYNAGSIIGVKNQSWLGYPDAGNYDYYELRLRIITHIRQQRPDFIITCDPWLTYEAHSDHVHTGRAVAEACLLYSMPRFKTNPEVDETYAPHEIKGIAFYFSNQPNAMVDISSTRERKHRALDCYNSQFTLEGLAELHAQVEFLERAFSQGTGFEFVEPLKILQPWQLHVSIMTANS